MNPQSDEIASAEDFRLRPPQDFSVVIHNADQRPLLTLRFDEADRLVAEYDEADLDEAAKVFVAEMVRMASTHRASLFGSTEGASNGR